MDDPDELEEEPEAASDEWDEFRGGDGNPIRVADLKSLDLENMPEEIQISVFDD